MSGVRRDDGGPAGSGDSARGGERAGSSGNARRAERSVVSR
ncbi:hypothetical protein [Micromonospora vulcania]|uniref:Uncharacterized protein n=1 Tax=Micromonospora vulcania TaxID=1441873 RepID=A0ABW1H053_9ACTN